MAGHKTSKLDMQQILQHAYDDANQRLRTDASISASGISFDVNLEAPSDSVAVSDGTNIVRPTADGSVKVKNALHDDLNANANIQVNNTDVSYANPVPTATTNGALETTQQQVLTELQNANLSLDEIELDTEQIKLATQSIDSDIDVPLSTRASEATQQQVLTELQNLNTSVDNIESDVDAIRIATQSIDTDIDVALSTRASEATQLDVLAKATSIDNKINNNYGLATGAVRTASQIGNVTGAADFGQGNTSAQTLRTEANQGQPTNIANSWPVKITDGTDATTVKVVKDNMYYNNSDFGLPIYGVDSDTPRKYRALRVDVDGDIYSHIVDPNNNSITSTLVGAAQSLDVNITQSVLPAGAATETTLNSINTKINNNYGAATGAVRTASQIGNVNGQADFGAGPTGLQTLRTAVNITRNGTELSYNQGTSDANTIRNASNISDSLGNTLNHYQNQLQVADIVTASGGQAALTVGTTAVEVKVSTNALTGRKIVTVFNNSLVTIYWGRTSGVTTASGTPIFSNQMMTFEGFQASQAIYLIAGIAGNNVRITES